MNSETSYESSDSEIESIEEKWVECVVDRNYEISSKYPHEIRRKGTNTNIKLTLKPNGYLQCALNGKKLYHHRIVALQFIPNPDNKQEVDHINRIRNDNRISNLRWVSHYENMQNLGERSGYAGKSFIFTEEIDKDCIKIEKYGNRELEGYYYDFNLDQFYYEVETNKYRLLNVCNCKDGRKIILMLDKNRVKFQLCIKKFLADYELI